VNADAIARGLNAFNPEGEAMRAGRIMLEHIHELASEKVDFAIETTLAGKTYAPWLESIRATGYEVYLFYYWLNTPEAAIARVAARVQSGGHHVPDETVRQRYSRSVRNFFELYSPLADEWRLYDNSEGLRRLVALAVNGREHVLDGDTGFDIRRSAGYG
jgi:predicted ABC-type ATPase